MVVAVSVVDVVKVPVDDVIGVIAVRDRVVAARRPVRVVLSVAVAVV
jgi:hypothetical protein